MQSPPPSSLVELAAQHGIVASYRDISGQVQHASTTALLALLDCLGVSLTNPEAAPERLRASQAEQARRLVEPVTVAWQPNLPRVPLNLSSTPNTAHCEVRVDVEDGSTLHPEPKLVAADGKVFLDLPALPLGRHRVSIQLAGDEASTWLLNAPRVAWPAKPPCWGLFAPCYALHDERCKTGTFSHLAELARFTAKQGGGLLGTLPLLPNYLTQPFDPSPYAPISRLFWSDFFLDLPALAQAQQCRTALQFIAEYSDLETQQLQGPEHLIEYGELHRLRRAVLLELSGHFFATESTERAAFQAFVSEHPQVDPYARFRAVMTQRRSYFRDWPLQLLQQIQRGEVPSAEASPAEVDTHRYAQWRAHQQLSEVATRARQDGAGLYLDLPIGTHSNGFDAWYHDAAFLARCSAGAPPDPFFSKGQDWGFAPLHPQGSRAQGHSYLQACLKHHMRMAEVLRVDHVMGLHRIFCIPHGLGGADGAYVRFQQEELYALMCMESVRHCCTVVGEDLGTVPPEVREKMSQHGLVRMYVGQFSLSEQEPVLAAPPRDALVALNTHDMPPFAAFLHGRDIEERVALGALAAEAAPHEHGERQRLVRALRNAYAPGGDDLALLRAVLEHLAQTPTPYLLVALEDLWLETAPQNVPGTFLERPNWRRRMAHDLHNIQQDSSILDTLRRLARPAPATS
jgi:4-alpha-glucanotransferase